MRIGKIPENVLKRSVFKNIKLRSKGVLSTGRVGADCSLIQATDEKIVSVSTNPCVIDFNNIDLYGTLAIVRAANNVYTCGATISGVETDVLLPETIEEKDIKSLIRSLDSAAENEGISILGGHTEITSAVNLPVVTVTAIGTIDKESVIIPGNVKSGDDIVYTKWIALEETAILSACKEEELKKRFSDGFVNRAKDFKELLSVKKDAEAIRKCDVSGIHDVGSRGVFAALWEMAEGSNVGLSVDLMKIPVKQESVEIFEEYGLNPYEAKSAGSLLITTGNGADVVNALRDKGINAEVIGKITDSNDRVIINGDEKRFLEPVK